MAVGNRGLLECSRCCRDGAGVSRDEGLVEVKDEIGGVFLRRKFNDRSQRALSPYVLWLRSPPSIDDDSANANAHQAAYGISDLAREVRHSSGVVLGPLEGIGTDLGKPVIGEDVAAAAPLLGGGGVQPVEWFHAAGIAAVERQSQR